MMSSPSAFTQRAYGVSFSVANFFARSSEARASLAMGDSPSILANLFCPLLVQFLYQVGASSAVSYSRSHALAAWRTEWRRTCPPSCAHRSDHRSASAATDAPVTAAQHRPP